MKAGFFDANETGVEIDDAEFVIIGSGAGGGAAARTLARSGAKVVVLEEGPFVSTSQLNPLMNESMAVLFRHQGKMAAFGRATTPILQGRCVGGTTFVNSAIIWRLPAKVLADWHARFGLADGLPAQALEDASAVIEEEMSETAVKEGVNANRQDLLLRDGAAKSQLEGRFIHRAEKNCLGSGRCLYGCPNEAKQSTTINYLKRAVADGAAVYANAGVEKIFFRGKRAEAVTGLAGGKGKRFRVAAKKAVIVCASVIQSPNLLRRSGLGMRALGEHFMAHPGTTVMGIYPDRVNMWLGASQGYEVLGLRDTLGVKLESINVPPEVAAARLPGAGARLARYIDRLDRVACWAVAIRSEAEGRIRPSWLFGDKVSYNLTAGDMDRVRKGMKRLAEMHFNAGAEEIVTGIHGLPETMTSIDQIGAFDEAPVDPRAYSMVATHLFGGCRAGADPERAVVDPQLKVHGTDGLYVMDASIFPTNTGVNPQHSIMTIATVASQRLVG